MPTALGDPWAIGYAVQVARDCPGWEVERQEELARRGILPRWEFGSSTLAPNGAFHRLFYQGQSAAKADRKRVEDFCNRVPAAAANRWPRLAHVLRPAG